MSKKKIKEMLAAKGLKEGDQFADRFDNMSRNHESVKEGERMELSRVPL
jgi:hypothetical protein